MSPDCWLAGASPMKKNVVNLDALLRREDFEAEGEVIGKKQEQAWTDARSIPVTQLGKGEVWFLTVRKPDFQRETASWSPKKVCDLIETCINGDLIPAIIMW